ncbi:MAG: hypothetical protein ACJ75J_17365 [Cytophagaceae bacterium]
MNYNTCRLCFYRVKEDVFMGDRKLLNNGYYTLFENEYGRRVLVLDGKEWFVWTVEDLGPTLTFSQPWTIHSTSDYKMIMQGKYFLEDVENDRLMPHLFLEEDGAYIELILTQGLPSTIDSSKSFIITSRVLPPEFVENYDEFVVSSHQVIDG